MSTFYWSIREKLALACAVQRVGDQNWASVAKIVLPYGESTRATDWCVGKECAQNYASLLESVDAPRRASSRAEVGSGVNRFAVGGNLPPEERLVKCFTLERIEELQRLVQQESSLYARLRKEQKDFKAGRMSSERIRELLVDSELQQRQAKACADPDEIIPITSSELSSIEAAEKSIFVTDNSSNSKAVTGKGTNRSTRRSSTAAQNRRHQGINVITLAATTNSTTALLKEDKDIAQIDSNGVESADTLNSVLPAESSTSSEQQPTSTAYELPLDMPDATATPIDEVSGLPESTDQQSADNEAIKVEDLNTKKISSEAIEMPAPSASGLITVAASRSRRLTGASSCSDAEDMSASGKNLSEEGGIGRERRALRKSLMVVLDVALSHKHGSVFMHPVTEEMAPGYNQVVHRPMDLTTIKRRVECGEIKSQMEFRRDLMLMCTNAVMYNNSDHDVHRMSEELFQDITIAFDQYLGDSNEMLSGINDENDGNYSGQTCQPAYQPTLAVAVNESGLHSDSPPDNSGSTSRTIGGALTDSSESTSVDSIKKRRLTTENSDVSKKRKV